MGFRTSMPDETQLYTAKHYARNKVTKKIDLDKDVPTPFPFGYVDDKGKQALIEYILPNRSTPGDSVVIYSDYIPVKTDEIVFIGEDQYVVSGGKPIRNSGYDLRTLRGVTNVSNVYVLDK